MRIAIICENFPPASFEGGIAHYSHWLAKSLKLRGHKIYAITSTEYSLPVHSEEKIDEIARIYIKGPWNHHTIIVFKKIIFEKSLDVLILQYTPASFSLTFRLKWAFSRFDCQKIMVFHTLWGKDFDRIIGILNLVGCKKIIATNSEIMAILKRRMPFLIKKTYWIPIASNIKRHNWRKYKNSNDSKIISFFGMLYPGKGLDLILNVLEELSQKYNNFNFKFIGGGMLNHESYERAFLKEIKRRKLIGRVELLGLISPKEVSKWLGISRFVFLPYERGLSDRRGSLMAAIDHGKAILTAPPAVPMNLFKNGKNILWPNRPSQNEYVELAEKLLNDDQMISRLERGAKELSSNFKWENIAKAYESVLLN
jgi:glycosyltransferase involved in cell wall biosynthesis